MDLSRLSQAEKIAGGAGIALLIVMFFSWYSVGPFSVDAWEAFSYTDLILFITGVAAITLAVVAAKPVRPRSARRSQLGRRRLGSVGDCSSCFG